MGEKKVIWFSDVGARWTGSSISETASGNFWDVHAQPFLALFKTNSRNKSDEQEFCAMKRRVDEKGQRKNGQSGSSLQATATQITALYDLGE